MYIDTPMARTYRPQKLPGELGIIEAAALAGIPFTTLRTHVDTHKVMGVRRAPSGRRYISREGFLAYCRARGLTPKGGDALNRRRAERIWMHNVSAELRVLDPGSGKVLGRGEGAMGDLSATGFQVRDLAWEGFLPGPGTEVAFRVLNGELKDARGKALPAWVVYRDGRLGLGLEVLGRPSWRAVLREGIESKRRVAEDLLSGITGGRP